MVMNNTLLCITIVESFYIFYMYNLFKTTFSVHHPFEVLLQKQNMYDFLKHPVSTGAYESKICLLGNIVSYVLIVWLWIRLYIKDTKKLFVWNTVLFTIVAVCALLMNMNAFLYLLPVFLYEWFVVKTLW